LKRNNRHLNKKIRCFGRPPFESPVITSRASIKRIGFKLCHCLELTMYRIVHTTSATILFESYTLWTKASRILKLFCRH